MASDILHQNRPTSILVFILLLCGQPMFSQEGLNRDGNVGEELVVRNNDHAFLGQKSFNSILNFYNWILGSGASFGNPPDCTSCIPIVNIQRTAGWDWQFTAEQGVSIAGIQFEHFMFLTTGNESYIDRINFSPSMSFGTFNSAMYSDSELDAMDFNNHGTYDEAVIEISFRVDGFNGIQVPYQFASEEYPEYVGSQFNDAFGIFIAGPGISGWELISTVPNTSKEVRVNTINNGNLGVLADGSPVDLGNSEYHIDNNDGLPGPVRTEFDGITELLYAQKSGLIQGEEYRIKIGMADMGDYGWDSGVYFGPIEGLINNSPLPVEWHSFHVREVLRDVLVEWSTASEVDNAGFEVQRSVDGDVWETIDFVGGAGISSTVIDYFVEDKEPLDGWSYYRVKQIDFDGTFDFSTIQGVFVQPEEDKKGVLRLFPNPSSGLFELAFEDMDMRGLTLHISDMNGSIVLNEVIPTQMSSMAIDTELDKGIYLLTLSNASGIVGSERLVID